MHTVGGAGPDVALAVDRHAIAITGCNLMKESAAGQRAVRAYVKHPDALPRVRLRLVARLRHIEPVLVGRERNTVRPRKILCCDRYGAACRVEAIDGRRLFTRLEAAFIIVGKPVNRIGEPDRPISLYRHVVRRVQAAPIIAVN